MSPQTPRRTTPVSPSTPCRFTTKKTTLSVLFGLTTIAPLSQAATLGVNIMDSIFIRSSVPTTVQGSPAGAAVSNLFGDITGSDDDLRAIFSVSLADPILAGQTITGATLQLKISALDNGTPASASTTETIQLFQLTQSFVENQASWNSASTGTAWTTAGGTFSGSPLATTTANPATVTVGNALDFSSASLASLAQSSIGSTLYFIVKLETEDNALRSIFRVGGDDNTTTSLRPQFEVQYVPEPSAAALGGIGCLMLLRRRRQG